MCTQVLTQVLTHVVSVRVFVFHSRAFCSTPNWGLRPHFGALHHHEYGKQTFQSHVRHGCLPMCVSVRVCVVFQGFVRHTKLGSYRLKEVWQEAGVRREILASFLADQRIKYELSRSELPLSGRDLQPALVASVQALVEGQQVRAVP